MLALGASGAGAEVDEDDYNSNMATPTYLKSQIKHKIQYHICCF
jgi:hypothetical protein